MFAWDRGSLRKRKNKQFCVQELSADRAFLELTRQGGKLSVLLIVIPNAKFLNKLKKRRLKALNSSMMNFASLKTNNFQ